MERKSLNGSSAKSSDTLVITLRNDFPPLSFLSVEGQPAGLFVDMWRLWAEKTGRKIEFHCAAFQDTLDSFKKGTSDIYSALNYSEERSEWIAFSQPIYELSFCFFFSKKHGKALNISELNGQKVGVTRGTYLEEQLHKRYPDIEVVPFAANEDMIRAALEGKILAFLSTPASTSVMLRQMGLAVEFESSDEKFFTRTLHAGVLKHNKELSDEKFFTRTLHAGVLKHNKELLSLVDKGLDLISNQELAEIEQRWVPDPDKRYYGTPPNSPLEGGQREAMNRLTAAEEAWIRAHHTIKISVPAVFPPVMFLAEDKRFQGMVQDYLDLFSKRTGMHFNPFYAPLSELPELIQTRRTDIFPAFMGLQPNQFMDLTDSCFTISWVIVNRLDAPFLRDVKDLTGMKVAIVKDIPLYNHLKKDHPEIELYPADNPVTAMQSVSSGNADAFVGAFVVAGYVMQKYQIGNLKIAGQAENEDFLFKFAVRNDWPELISILNKVIRFTTPQEHDQIFHKWMPIRYEHTVAWQTVIKWVLWVGGILGMISGLMLFWNRKLAKEILQRKTVESALQDSEEQFRLVFEQSRDAVFWADPETGIIINCNAKAEEITERTREELIWMHQSRLHPSEQDGTEAFQHAVAQDIPNIEAEVISRTGKITPVL
ncbi:MAG: transporter substrate-binding domain-containing protein, partial [Deltaproteobacteria bacterium]|nr:transporter substrate-binding domain-containing protein [Deltaproteobacteria bacterium]